MIWPGPSSRVRQPWLWQLNGRAEAHSSPGSMASVLVVAFPGGTGTASLVREARRMASHSPVPISGAEVSSADFAAEAFWPLWRVPARPVSYSSAFTVMPVLTPIPTAVPVANSVPQVAGPACSLQRSGSLWQLEAALLADEGNKQALAAEWLTFSTTSKPDKNAIKEALKAGRQITGAQLHNRRCSGPFLPDPISLLSSSRSIASHRHDHCRSFRQWVQHQQSPSALEVIRSSERSDLGSPFWTIKQAERIF